MKIIRWFIVAVLCVVAFLFGNVLGTIAFVVYYAIENPREWEFLMAVLGVQ